MKQPSNKEQNMNKKNEGLTLHEFVFTEPDTHSVIGLQWSVFIHPSIDSNDAKFR